LSRASVFSCPRKPIRALSIRIENLLDCRLGRHIATPVARITQDGGLGIGLALAKGLIELHGGRIEVSSPGLGRGSVFSVRLPIGTLAAPSETGSGVLPDQGASTSRRVLIADDNHDSAESLAMLLRMEGHEVMVVHDGPGALAAVGSFAPEIALLDIGMPGMNGYEVAQKIREALPASPLRLVALTGWGQHSDKARARVRLRSSLHKANRAGAIDGAAARSRLRRARTWSRGRTRRPRIPAPEFSPGYSQ
jgi:CheY-like chemotaxis protein